MAEAAIDTPPPPHRPYHRKIHFMKAVVTLPGPSGRVAQRLQPLARRAPSAGVLTSVRITGRLIASRGSTHTPPLSHSLLDCSLLSILHSSLPTYKGTHTTFCSGAGACRALGIV